VGLLILIATPVARVALAAVAFAVARGKLYAVVTLVVLLILVSIGFRDKITRSAAFPGSSVPRWFSMPSCHAAFVVIVRSA